MRNALVEVALRGPDQAAGPMRMVYELLRSGQRRPAHTQPEPITEQAGVPDDDGPERQDPGTAASLRTPPVPPATPDTAPPPQRDPLGTGGDSGAAGPPGPDRASGEVEPILVRPFAGAGIPALFDPQTGSLQVGDRTGRQQSGVYGDLGDIPVVFYREPGRGLVLRIGEHRVECTDAVTTWWTSAGPRTSRFGVAVDGTVLADMTYRALPRDLDLGAYINAVLADDDRRGTVFD
jgi:homeobox protein ESX1